MATLSCSTSCKDVRNPIKLSSGCSTERYMMRQRYLRSYPLMMNKKKENLAGNVAKRTKKWLKEKQRSTAGSMIRRISRQGGLEEIRNLNPILVSPTLKPA
ncbi:hypothetical protein CRYUN_Cryun22dG0106800 [Craigia yunnanensis]